LLDCSDKEREALHQIVTRFIEGTAFENFFSRMRLYGKKLGALTTLLPILICQRQLGIAKGERIRAIFEEWIYAETNIKNCTFRELHDLIVSKDPKYAKLKDLYVVAVSLNSQKTEVFSCEHTPDMIISDAIRCSMAIPLIFTPHGHYIKLPGNNYNDVEQLERAQLISNGLKPLYVDGGVFDNYPDWIFEKGSTLGFRLLTPQLMSKYTSSSEAVNINSLQYMSFLQYVGRLISTYRRKQESDFANRADPERVILIDTKEIGTVDFKVLDLEGKAQKDHLIASGQKAAQDYYAKLGCTFLDHIDRTDYSMSMSNDDHKT
jgi:NTE family protein